MALQNWRLLMDHVSFELPGTLQLPKWYTHITEVVHRSCRNGTLSLPKTGTLLLADHIRSKLVNFSLFIPQFNCFIKAFQRFPAISIRVILLPR